MSSAGGVDSAQSNGKDARVIEHEQIAGAEKLGKVEKMLVVELAGRAIENEEAGGVAVGSGTLGDEIGGQIVIKIGSAEHRWGR